jgi:hypothetical protein
VSLTDKKGRKLRKLHRCKHHKFSYKFSVSLCRLWDIAPHSMAIIHTSHSKSHNKPLNSLEYQHKVEFSRLGETLCLYLSNTLINSDAAVRFHPVQWTLCLNLELDHRSSSSNSSNLKLDFEGPVP